MSTPFDAMSLDELADHVRKERFSCRSLHRVLALAKGVRRAALLGIDPAHPDDLIEFDDDLDAACTVLSRIVHQLVTIRERVDRKRIEAERSARSGAYTRTHARKIAYSTATPKVYPAGHSSIEQKRRLRAALDKMDPAQVLQLLREIKEGLES